MSTKSPDHSWPRDWWGWGLIVAASLILLPHLESSGLLWQDEAETAVLANNTLQFGYPRVFDGVNRINPGLVTGPGESWSFHPWLQFYLTALSFWIFGSTTVAARFPFALLGIVTVWLTYRVALRVLQHVGIARLASLLTLCSVPLILHTRQCRYYALVTLCTMWALLAYLNAKEGKRGAWCWLVIALVALFNSHHGAFLPTFAAIILAHWLSWRQETPLHRRRVAIAVAMPIILLTIPWFFILNLTQHQGTLAPKELSHHLQFYIRQTNHYIIPLGFFALLWVLRRIRPVGWWRSLATPQREAVALVLWFLALNAVFIVAVPWQRHFRYILHMLPALYILEAVALWMWLGRRPWLLGVVTVLLLTTDIFHYSGPYVVAQAIPRLRAKISREHGLIKPQSLLADYAYELTHSYRGPLEGIVGVLVRSASPGETVKTPYDDHAVIFYAGLKVEDLNRFTAETYPVWIIPRKDWIPGDFFTSPYFQRIKQYYERIEVDAPDLVWQNRPDPGYHKFRTVTEAPHVVMYRRRTVPPS